MGAKALEKLKGAEAQLAADLKAKAAAAAAKKAKDAAAGANAANAAAKGKYAHEKGQLTAAQAKLAGLKNQASKDRNDRKSIASKVKSASHIDIPKGTDIKDAHKILESKRQAVQKYSAELLKKIGTEKNNLHKEKAEEKKVAETAKKVEGEKGKLVATAAAAKATAAKATAAKKTEEKDKAKADKAKAVAAQENKAEASAKKKSGQGGCQSRRCRSQAKSNAGSIKSD